MPNTLVLGPRKARKRAGRKGEKKGKRKGGEGERREGEKKERNERKWEDKRFVRERPGEAGILGVKGREGEKKAEEKREAGDGETRLQPRAPHARASAPPRLPPSKNFCHRGAEQAALAAFQHTVAAVSEGCWKWNN